MKNGIIGYAVQWLGCVAALSGTYAAPGAEFYVAGSGDDSRAGTNWATARRTIQAGVALAAGGDTVWVSNGTYSAAAEGPVWANGKTFIVVTNGIALRGFSGRDATIIHGGHPAFSNRCVYLGHSNAVLSGFTVTRGYPVDSTLRPQGCGIYAVPGATVSNCIIAANGSREYAHGGGGVFGGTVHNSIVSHNEAGGESGSNGGGGGAKNSELYNCSLSNNYSIAGGGGALASSLYGCVIVSNSAAQGGGASGGALYNCEVRGNSASSHGGGVFYASVYGCLIAGNRAQNEGGGVWMDANYNRYAENSTIVGNQAATGSGGGLKNLHVYNCIVWSNAAPASPDISTIRAIENTCSPDVAPGVNGNITDAPDFVKWGVGAGLTHAAGNCRLRSGSPCIDQGQVRTWMTNRWAQADIDGNKRIAGDAPDMGAYEWQPPPKGTIVTFF